MTTPSGLASARNRLPTSSRSRRSRRLAEKSKCKGALQQFQLQSKVWKTWNPNCTHGHHDLLIAVKEEDSSPLFLSPRSNAPHTLIAGSTGSGKSVLMQNIILGIACTNTTDQARIVLIDPKLGVDYFAFEGLPHLQGGIIDAQDNAILTLNELVGEMNRRYAVLKALQRFQQTGW